MSTTDLKSFAGPRPNPEIVIGWTGLPIYAARLIRNVCAGYSGCIEVVATKATVPFENVEKELGRRVRWLDGDDEITWSALGMGIPKFFFHTAWNVPAFNALARQVRDDGGRVVILIDNCRKKTLRQAIGSVYFRLRRKADYAAAIVPGSSARKFAAQLGFSERLIFDGQYGIELAAYQGNGAVKNRPRVFLFVGQLIERKGVDTLVDAWRGFENRGWTLRVCGVGPLERAVRGIPTIDYRGFLQPSELVREYAGSRVLILPSREDHFPLVTIEAAASGCGLLVSEVVGTRAELEAEKNLRSFSPGDVNGLRAAMERFVSLAEEDWAAVEAGSRSRAASFGVDRLSQAINRCLQVFKAQ